jgi:hypothetical protein
MALGTLVAGPKTKIGNEVLIYANLGVGILTNRLGYGVNIVETPCVAGVACPAGSFQATVLNKPNVGAVGIIPANYPVFAAAEGVQAPSVAGDTADVLCLPNPDDDFLICFDQGIQVGIGQTFRNIPRKFNPVDHSVRQRGDYSLTLNDLFISSTAGIQKVRGRPCTIIVKIFPDGGGSASEIQYYTNVTLNVPPMNTGNDGNASIEIQGTGNFSFCATFGPGFTV